MEATTATKRLMGLCCCLSGVILLSFLLPGALAEERFYEFVVRASILSSVQSCLLVFLLLALALVGNA